LWRFALALGAFYRGFFARRFAFLWSWFLTIIAKGVLGRAHSRLGDRKLIP